MNFFDHPYVGHRIRLLYMEDPLPIPPLEEGLVVMVDDMGQIHVKWDCGRSLAVIPEVDRYEILF